jgi:cellulose synthase (UDP-forming)
MRTFADARVTRISSLVALASVVLYVAWRVTALNPAALPFALVEFLAEAYYAAVFCWSVVTTWSVDPVTPAADRAGLRVDVFILTADANVELLETTLVGCRSLVGPHTTCVLDREHRPVAAELATRWGCRYLDNPDAATTADLVNGALARSSGDVVALLCAGTVPQPDFLDRTVAYFGDPRVALVQLPRVAYNLDSVQHQRSGRGVLPEDDLARFDRVVQAGKNRWNAATWQFDGSLIRRHALLDVGGIVPSGVTPDFRISLRLHARGWKTIFHDESLAYGAAPPTLAAWRVQLLGQARGALRMLVCRDNPVLVPGLAPAQRLAYLGSLLAALDPGPRLVLVITPLAILATGRLPIRVGGGELLAHGLPCVALAVLAERARGRDLAALWRLERARFVALCACLTIPLALSDGHRPGAWTRPDADGASSPSRPTLILLPSLVLVGVGWLAWLLGLVSLRRVPVLPNPPEAVCLALIWLGATGGLLSIALVSLLHRPRRRADYRFPIPLTTTLNSTRGGAIDVTVRDISLGGCGLVTWSDARRGREVSLELRLEGRPVGVRGEVVARRRLPDGQTHLGVRFTHIAPHDRARLVAFLFVVAPRLQQLRATSASWQEVVARYQAGIPGWQARLPRVAGDPTPEQAGAAALRRRAGLQREQCRPYASRDAFPAALGLPGTAPEPARTPTDQPRTRAPASEHGRGRKEFPAPRDHLRPAAVAAADSCR